MDPGRNPHGGGVVASREATQARMDRVSAGMLRHTPEQTYTVADRLEELATRSPDRLFLRFEDRDLTYAALNALANRHAHLALQLGVRPGDVVALMMENRPEFLAVWFGLAKIGCVSALINAQIGGEALGHALSVTGSRFLFIGDECAVRPDAAARPVLPGCVVPDPARAAPAAAGGSEWLAGQPDTNPAADLRRGVTGASTLSLVFTSGTTGLPKAAKITHARWLGVGEGWCNLLELGPDDVFYCVLPLYHVAALMSLFSNAMACGGSVVLRRRFSASAFWDDVRRHGVTVAQYSGEMCRYLHNRPPCPDDREHRLRVMTGSGLSPAIWQSFQQRFGIAQLIEGYGGTELNVGMMNLDNRVGSCGRIPFKDRSNARLVRYDRENDRLWRDADGRVVECGPGEVGEMLGMILNLPGITGGRFDGYTDPTATEQKILRDVFCPGDAWMRTGDLFQRDADDYYYFVDRVGDTFRWKSENVSTAEVANALGDYPGVETVTVYGVTIQGHEGRAGMATLVLPPGQQLDPVAFHAYARARLPDYAMPVFVRVQHEADLTTTLKLRKVDLQRLGFAQRVGDELYVADPDARAYVAATDEALKRLGITPSATEPNEGCRDE